jgi:hypothetical protein
LGFASVAVDIDSSQRDERFARAAFGYDHEAKLAAPLWRGLAGWQSTFWSMAQGQVRRSHIIIGERQHLAGRFCVELNGGSCGIDVHRERQVTAGEQNYQHQQPIRSTYYLRTGA